MCVSVCLNAAPSCCGVPRCGLSRCLRWFWSLQIWIPLSRLSEVFEESAIVAHDPLQSQSVNTTHLHWLQPGEREASLSGDVAPPPEVEDRACVLFRRRAHLVWPAGSRVCLCVCSSVGAAKAKKAPPAKGKPAAPVAADASASAPVTDITQRAVLQPPRHLLVSTPDFPGANVVISVFRDPSASASESKGVEDDDNYAVVSVTEDSSYSHFATTVQRQPGAGACFCVCRGPACGGEVPS